MCKCVPSGCLKMSEKRIGRELWHALCMQKIDCALGVGHAFFRLLKFSFEIRLLAGKSARCAASGALSLSSGNPHLIGKTESAAESAIFYTAAFWFSLPPPQKSFAAARHFFYSAFSPFLSRTNASDLTVSSVHAGKKPLRTALRTDARFDHAAQ